MAEVKDLTAAVLHADSPGVGNVMVTGTVFINKGLYINATNVAEVISSRNISN